MNKVTTINLSGRLITIDEEAFQQLSAYLKWLQQFFSKEAGGMEIYRDMEDRIAELFEDKLSKNLVSISAEDVQAVIKIMGSPEQIAMETSENYEEQAHTVNETLASESIAQAQSGAQPLKRNLSDKVLGGVCSGLANYFQADPALVRVLMVLGFFLYGTTGFIYILLWIILPGTYQSSNNTLKRRWYRSDEGKMIGGVCNGLSYQLKTPKQVLRAAFAFPLIGVIFFNIINENDLASFCTAALPTMTIIYIVLWIALPRASSLTQKMELKGEKLDVQNLSTALKVYNEQNEQQVQRNSSNAFSAIIKVFAYIVLGFVLLVVGSILIGLLIAMIGVLFGFSAVGIGMWPLSNLIFESQLQAYALYIASVLLILVPIVAIIRWLVLRVKKPVRKIKWIGYGLSSLFLISLFTLVYVATDLASSFKYSYRTQDNFAMQQPKDTLIITQIAAKEEWNNDRNMDWIRRGNNNRFELQIASLDIQAADGDLYELKLERQSNGRSPLQAKELAMQVPYQYEQDSNSLRLPRYVELGAAQVFRGQLVTAKVYIPKGKIFKIGDLPRNYTKSWMITSNPFYSIRVKNKRWQPNSYYKMNDDGSIELLYGAD